jgi:hypothetical protein
MARICVTSRCSSASQFFDACIEQFDRSRGIGNVLRVRLPLRDAGFDLGDSVAYAHVF